MSIATTVGDALAFEEIDFRILRQKSTLSPVQAAERAGIPPEGLARAVLLKDPYGYILAVIPALHEPDLALLQDNLHRRLSVATSQDLDDLFCDCAVGSVPPIGPWYRVPTVVDIALRDQPEVFFEGRRQPIAGPGQRHQLRAPDAWRRIFRFLPPGFGLTAGCP